jgi:glycosyltransferase involved in cell wall biosynthesis
VRDGVNGVLVDPGSADSLARAFAELNTEKLADLAEGARANRSRLTWGGYAAELEGLLGKVVTGNSEVGIQSSEFHPPTPP